MQIKINLFIVYSFIRSLGTFFLGVLLFISAGKVQDDRTLQVLLLVSMSYLLTVSVYRFVRSFKTVKQLEEFLKALDKTE